MNLKKIDQKIKIGDIKIHIVGLPPGLYGFVYYSKKGRYHVFISDALAPLARQEVLFHEIHHIMVDMPKITYFVGLDMQYKKFECRARTIAREGLRNTWLKKEGVKPDEKILL